MEYVENSAATDAFQLNANNAATAIVNNLSFIYIRLCLNISYLIVKTNFNMNSLFTVPSWKLWQFRSSNPRRTS